MGINRVMFNAVKDLIWNYGCYEDEVREFLFKRWGFQRRQKEAISIVNGIMTTHGKQELLGHVAELARVEYGIRELEPWVRDHVVHALLSFILGIHINENFMRPLGYRVDSFQWKLSGLFHDIGYPVQVAGDVAKPFTDKINTIKVNLNVIAPDVFFRLIPVGLNQLTNGVESLSLIQQKIDDWGLSVDASREYREMLDSGRICHGIISSLSVLYIIDLMYQKYNPRREYHDIYDPPGIIWNQSYFENDVVSACAAIFLHNLPARCFAGAPLDKERAPLAFLLRLADCLQDWDRPSADNPHGIPNREFNINITGGRLIFTVNDPDRKNKISTDIEATMFTSGIEIQ